MFLIPRLMMKLLEEMPRLCSEKPEGKQKQWKKRKRQQKKKQR